MISVSFNWLDNPVKKLRHFRPSTQRRMQKKAIRAGMRPVRNRAKSLSPRRTGSLKSSYGIKIWEKKPATVIGMTGPKYAYVKQIKGKRVRPSKYALLVERGHGGQRGPAAPVRFLEQAKTATKNQFRSLVLQSLRESIKQQWAKKVK